MFSRALKAVATISGDFLLIAQSPHSIHRKWALSRSYMKIAFIHYFMENAVNLKTVRFLDFSVETFNYYNFYYLYREIFIKGEYYASHIMSSIIDCGANIGMATLYFKWLWPDSKITCFEPDKATYELLVKNIARNKLTGVQTYNVALSDSESELVFNVNNKNPGSLKMSLYKERFGEGDTYKVKAVDFSKYLAEKVDLVKMDIEGAEYAVMASAANRHVLQNARQLIVEYHHNIPGENRTFSNFLKIFEDSGYSYNLESPLDHYSSRHFQDILIRFQLS